MSDSTRLEILMSVPLDSWVALSDDETQVIAVGRTYDEVVEKSEKAGVSNPTILKTPPRWAPFSV